MSWNCFLIRAIYIVISLLTLCDQVVGWVCTTAQNRQLSSPSLSSLKIEPLKTRGNYHTRYRNKNMELFSSNDKQGGSFFERCASLADKYIVEMEAMEDETTKSGLNKFVWSLFSITNIVEGMDIISEGEQAKRSLYLPNLPSNVVQSPVAVLECSLVESNHLNVVVKQSYDEGGTVDDKLQQILARILVQWSVSRICESNDKSKDFKNLRISLTMGKKEEGPITVDMTSDKGYEELFDSVFDVSNTSFEWVEMVSGKGEILGRLPRPLVHTYNLLHRGIGLFVTKDKPMLPTPDDDSNFPDLYAHRRVDTKRIFPSLYDMFVGGVSVAEEDAQLTARREVAEELGLSLALSEDHTMSDPILECAICTSYNRCLVTLFHYTFKTNHESVSWQEEEVAWGDFVSYPVIAAAADRSIQRLAEDKSWPGSYPPIQSAWKGELKQDDDPIDSKPQDWESWDFVPDGLLVWDAWLNWLQRKEANST